MPPEVASQRSHWTLGQWLAWQEQLHPKRIELGLGRVRSVAQVLGLLEADARTVTVAGTNGKGSTAKLISSLLQAEGRSVGLYTSPHLLHYNERISINGELVDDAALCAAFRTVDAARADTSLTYFEFGTLAALYLFQQAQVSVQVLEVGLGGRLDAVNIIDTDCAVLTSIGLDHQDWLGSDLAGIASEKLGIARPGRPLVCGQIDPQADVSGQARKTGARVYQLGVDFDCAANAEAWTYSEPNLRWQALPLPQAAGSHQVGNAAVALQAVKQLLGRLPERPVAETGLASAALPGRTQRFGRVWLDVSHNAQAGQALAAQLQALPCTGKRHLLLAMLADKDAEAYLQTLSGSVDTLLCAGLSGERGRDAAQLKQAVSDVWPADVQVAETVVEGLAALEASADPDDEIVVCGSFHTVAEALAVLS